jgi:hypothetical protein
MAKVKERVTAKVTESLESQWLVKTQALDAGALIDRRQRTECRKQKGGRARARREARRRGQAHLPHLELDDLNCQSLIERLSKLD